MKSCLVKLYLILFATMIAVLPCYAQQATVVGINPPCSVFGTAAGTCAQGNDSRITGAAQQTMAAWTPTDGSGAGLSLTVSAAYTRIGNMVFAYASITYPVTVDGNAAVISGFPVTNASANYGYGPTALLTGNIALSAQLAMYANTTTGHILSLASPNTAITNAQLSGLTIYFSVVYPAT